VEVSATETSKRGVRLVARRPDFEFRPEEIRRFYCQGSPVLTHVCNAFAVQISPLELFFLKDGKSALAGTLINNGSSGARSPEVLPRGERLCPRANRFDAGEARRGERVFLMVWHRTGIIPELRWWRHLRGGVRLICNEEEERYTGIKHYRGYPEQSIGSLLERLGDLGIGGKPLQSKHAGEHQPAGQVFGNAYAVAPMATYAAPCATSTFLQALPTTPTMRTTSW